VETRLYQDNNRNRAWLPHGIAAFRSIPRSAHWSRIVLTETKTG
jgi:hypothetical protein